MPKILITGATGFVGSHVLETLLTINHPDIEIVAACREPNALLPAFRGEVRVGDLRDPAYLDRLLVGIDSVCHTAGWTSFLKQDQACRRFYLEPTLELINRVLEWRIPRLVNLSSLAVSATGADDAPGVPLRGCPLYNGLLAVEHYLSHHAVNHPCSIVNLRLGIYSGKRLGLGLIPSLLGKGSGAVLHAAGDAVMPLVDGRDIGQAFARAALAPGLEGYHSLNIAGPEWPRQQDVMQFLRHQQRLSGPLLGLPLPLLRGLIGLSGFGPEGRMGKLSRCQLAMLARPGRPSDKARQRLGYDPEISWQASLLDTLAETQHGPAQPALHDPYEVSDLEQGTE